MLFVEWDNPRKKQTEGGWYIDHGNYRLASTAVNGIGPGAGKGARAEATERELARVGAKSVTAAHKTKRRSHLKLKVGDNVTLANGSVGVVTCTRLVWGPSVTDTSYINHVEVAGGGIETFTQRGRYYSTGSSESDIASVNGIPLVN
jgi:hypothetical protein